MIAYAALGLKPASGLCLEAWTTRVASGPRAVGVLRVGGGGEGVGQLGSRVAREVERDSRCHSQGHTHPHWALGEPVNDCSSVLLTFYCTTYVSSIDGLVLVRVGASLKPHTRRHSLLRRGLARGALKAGLTPQ